MVHCYTLLFVTPELKRSAVPDSDGNLGRRFPHRGIIVPRSVKIHVGHLVPEYHSDHRSLSKRIELSAATLTHFESLDSDEQIRRFAEKWGMLSLCPRHQFQPRQHGCEPTLNSGAFVSDFYGGIVGSFRVDSELVDAWRFHIGRLKAVVEVAAHLHENKKPNPKMFVTAVSSPPKESVKAIHESILKQASECSLSEMRRLLAATVNETLRDCGVSPQLLWNDGEDPKLVISGSIQSLLGALTFQALLAICLQDDVVVCDGCGNVYQPTERRPKRGTHHYCKRCKVAGIDARDRQRRHRQTKE